MKKSNFTIIYNDILDSDISLEALGLYIQIKRHVAKKNWQIKRNFFKNISGLGEVAFRRVWKELIDKGFLNRSIERIKGKFNYIFTLVNFEKEATKRNNKDLKDNKEELSNNTHKRKRLNESNYLDRRLESENKIEDSLIIRTKNSKERIISAINYSKSKGAKKIYNYALKTIENNWDDYKESSIISRANFKEREYDFEELERALLSYSLEYESREVNYVPRLPAIVGCDLENDKK